MTKSIKIWENRLEISKEKGYYMINNSELDLFIHADKLGFGIHAYNGKGWLVFYNEDKYIGSIWINTDTDMRVVRKFLEETK